MLPLFMGVVLAVLALAYLLQPLFRPAEYTRRPPSAADLAAANTVMVDEGGENAVEALREIEFDRATGKLSDSDYAVLKARYMGRAVTALRESDDAAAGIANAESAAVDEVEALVNRFRSKRRSCARCGPRLEPDARFCSDCGGALATACAKCGEEVTSPSARYCTNCGASLAA
jgi:rRNA maturation endonuclease Nob1